MNDVEYGNQFKKDFKVVKARGYKLELLKNVIGILMAGKPLPKQYHDHKLNNSKEYINVKECHIQSDWLLIYRLEKGLVTLIRTGTHADLY